MNKLITKLSMLIIALVMASCNDTEDIVTIDNICENQPSTMMKVTEDGYLHFESQSAFDKLYEEAKRSVSSSINSRASSSFNFSIPGFNSIKDISSTYNNTITSRAVSNTVEVEYDCEDGNEVECRLAIAEELIPDEALQCLLDTTFRIEIGNTYYRVTYNGTLYADIEYKEKVDSLAEEADIVARAPVATGVYEVDSDVCIADTYGRLCESEETEANDKTDEINAYNPWGGPSIPPITTTSPNVPTRQDSYFWGTEEENTNQYSLKNRKWSSNNWLGDLVEEITGCKYIKDENEFDKNHRVQCKLYDLNFVFVDIAGYKISLQKRKKFLMIPYWTSCDGAEDLVVGFEDFQGRIDVATPISIVNPIAYYETHLNGAVNNMIYAGLGKPTFIEDWAKEYLPCIFHGVISDKLSQWNCEPGKYTENLTREIIMAGAESLLGKKLEGMINAMKKGDPILNINPYSEKKHDFYIYGINGWKNTSKKSIKFNASFGFTWKIGSISGWTPEKYTIKRPQMFGAIKYDGKWRGIRFTKE